MTTASPTPANEPWREKLDRQIAECRDYILGRALDERISIQERRLKEHLGKEVAERFPFPLPLRGLIFKLAAAEWRRVIKQMTAAEGDGKAGEDDVEDRDEHEDDDASPP